MNGPRSTNGNGHVTPLGLITPSPWAALAGRWSFDAGESIYQGPLDQHRSYGLALSELKLQDGSARVTIVFEDLSEPSDVSAGIVLGF